MKISSFSSRLAKLEEETALSPPETCADPLQNPVFLSRLQKQEFLYASLGLSLAKTLDMGRNGLKIYCGVPVKYLCQDSLLQDEYLDFVICRGQNAVMALKLMGMDEQRFHETINKFRASSFPPGLVSFFQRDSFLDDPDWVAKNILAPAMGKCFQPGGPHVKSSLILIPSGLLKQLRAPSLQIVERPQYSKCWVPTEYGRSLGIFQGFRTDANNVVRPLLCCNRESLDTLRQAVSWSEQDVSAQTGERCSFSQRLDMANQGMTRNIAPVMDMVLHLGEMPLSDYFKDEPDVLLEMLNAFPKATNYQQAAAHIDGLRRLDTETFQHYVSDFIRPLVRENKIPITDKPLRSFFYAASLLVKSKYLTWRGDMIFRKHDAKDAGAKYPLRTWLKWADDKIKQEKEAPGYFCELAFHLAVEPFSLIEQQSKGRNSSSLLPKIS